jgi:rhodanese-related sulfurtransferase
MEKKYLCIVYLICALCFDAAGQTAFDEKLRSLYRNTVPLITVEALQSNLQKGKNVILLDIRTATEYNVSHLPRAKFVDYKNFKAHNLDTFSRETPIVLYCSVGYRSERVGERLLAMGFKDVKNLYGGIFEWVNKGYAVVDRNGKGTTHVHTYNRSWSKWLEKGVKVY